jgi:hypothetical protein
MYRFVTCFLHNDDGYTASCAAPNWRTKWNTKWHTAKMTRKKMAVEYFKVLRSGKGKNEHRLSPLICLAIISPLCKPPLRFLQLLLALRIAFYLSLWLGIVNGTEIGEIRRRWGSTRPTWIHAIRDHYFGIRLEWQRKVPRNLCPTIQSTGWQCCLSNHLPSQATAGWTVLWWKLEDHVKSLIHSWLRQQGWLTDGLATKK